MPRRDVYALVLAVQDLLRRERDPVIEHAATGGA